MGVYGIARDLAAAGLGTLKPLCMPEIKTEPVPARSASQLRIQMAVMPSWPARLSGVKNGTSPEWMQRALTAAGMRPISTLVDITNYFTLAFGRPLHVYDMAKLSGNITVRAGVEGETLAALNDKEYTLRVSDCVISDERGALGLGGIMGGSATGVSETTTDVLLEVALFKPERIAKTGRALQIESDARQRFERGVDAGFMEQAELRATDLVLELCGGTASERIIAGTIPTARTEIAFDATKISALIGVDVPEARQREILGKLGFTEKGTAMLAPTWRHDCSQPADLAEEVLRIVGYDAIPLTPLPKPSHISLPALSGEQARVSHLRRAAAARGLNETYSWGFCSAAQAVAWGGQSEALELLNPISADLSVMRPKILPHLVEAVRCNLARGITDIALFELGAVFKDVTPSGQKTVLSGLRVGNRAGLHWAETKAVDVFDAKADLLALLAAAGINTAQLSVMPTKDAPWFHPGRSGVVGLGPKNILGAFGELHPALLKQFGVDVPVYAFALFVSALPPVKASKRKALSISDYQPVTRDFAFVLPETTPSADLVKAVSAAEKGLLRDVTIFDVYAGKGIAPGQKSLALSVTLQADDRTLTDAEIEKVADAIVTSARKIGATLR
jgi:phenylalanyl-tRNA synthetase beta chain